MALRMRLRCRAQPRTSHGTESAARLPSRMPPPLCLTAFHPRVRAQIRFPEIVDLVPGQLIEGATSCVIDAEVCAFNRSSGQILPFQTLAERSRKAPTAEQIAAGSVCLFAFDLLQVPAPRVRAACPRRTSTCPRHARPLLRVRWGSLGCASTGTAHCLAD